jgi:hypothetical protein
MRRRWQTAVRFICVLLTLMVAFPLIPTVTDIAVAQGTGTPEVCQRIGRIMPRLLQTADRLRREQDQYQKDLDAEYLALQDAGAAVTAAGFTTKDQDVRNLILLIVQSLLKNIQLTRADMRRVAQEQTNVGIQIFHLRDVAASSQCAAPAAAQPAGPSTPPAGGPGAVYACNPNASMTLTVGAHSAKSVNCGNTYLPTTYTAYDQMQHVPVGTNLSGMAKLSGPLQTGWVLTVASSRREWCRVSSGDQCPFTAPLTALQDPRYGSEENFFVQVHAPNGNVAGQVQITVVWCTPGRPLLIGNYQGTCG